MKHSPRYYGNEPAYRCTCGRAWPCIMAFGDEPRRMVLGDIVPAEWALFNGNPWTLHGLRFARP